MNAMPSYAHKLPAKILLFVLLIPCASLYAQQIPTRYQQIARQHNIPPGILYAIALTESGKTIAPGMFRPWPWTLNVAGKPKRYATRKATWNAMRYYMKQGIQSIDIGLMQVNWRWNKHRLGNTWTALDPRFNVTAGAKILRDEYKKQGNWVSAIGSYHSPGKSQAQKQRAQKYAKRVITHLTKLTGRNYE